MFQVRQTRLAKTRLFPAYVRAHLWLNLFLHLLLFKIPLETLGQTPAQAAPLVLYVSPAGSDAGPGTASQPFGSLEHARDTARRLRRNAPGAKQPVEVILLGGDYVRTNGLELTAADSGEPGAPMTWQAAKGQHCRLLGGISRMLSAFSSVKD